MSEQPGFHDPKPGPIPPSERPSLADLRAQAQGGVECPDCGCRDFRVTNTWRPGDGTIRRLRKCRHCGHPLTTVEQVREENEDGN